MNGIGTAKSGSVSLDDFGVSTLKVISSITTNCSGEVIEPAFI